MQCRGRGNAVLSAALRTRTAAHVAAGGRGQLGWRVGASSRDVVGQLGTVSREHLVDLATQLGSSVAVDRDEDYGGAEHGQPAMRQRSPAPATRLESAAMPLSSSGRGGSLQRAR